MIDVKSLFDVMHGSARWCVLDADCRTVLPLIPKATHVICDPPYSEHVHTKSRAGARTLAMGNGDIGFSREAEFGFDHLDPALRRFCASQFARIAERWVLVFSDFESATWWRLSMEAAALDYVRTGLWQKLRATPQFTGDRPAVAAEAITIMHPQGRKRWNGGGKHAIWPAPVVQGASRLHTTEKPIELMKALIEDFTDENDLVIDPFCGSGTTGAACLYLGRRFIGCDNGTDKKTGRRNAAIAHARLSETREQGRLFTVQNF